MCFWMCFIVRLGQVGDGSLATYLHKIEKAGAKVDSIVSIFRNVVLTNIFRFQFTRPSTVITSLHSLLEQIDIRPAWDGAAAIKQIRPYVVRLTLHDLGIRLGHRTRYNDTLSCANILKRL